MTNRFERGYTPPNPINRRTSGGVDVVAVTATEAEADLLPYAGALYNVVTTQSTLNDPNWSTTSNYFITPSGQALDRTTYSALFNRIGTVWGSGNGSSTFNVVNINQFGAGAPFPVSVSPTVYTSVGTYGSGNFVQHSHIISNANQSTWLYNGTGGDQRGNYATTPVTALSGTPAGDTYQTPNHARCRSFLSFKDSTDSLPLGTLIAHLCPISQISTVLADNPKLLVASGQTISASEYTNYVAANGATLPDLRGRFLRQDIANVNMPSSTYEMQGTTFAFHGHRWTTGTLGIFGTYTQVGRFRDGFTSLSGAWFGATTGTPYSLGPGNETRPYNTSVTYLIKVKP